MSNIIPTINITEGFKITSPKYVQPISEVDENTLPVMEVFYSLEGEGSFIGQPRVLARIGGCLVGCEGCDTPHSWGLKSSQLMSLEDLVHMIEAECSSKTKVVAITGGEPMHYPVQMTKLARMLKAKGFYLWLETSGLIEDQNVFDEFDFLSLDIKTPSSGLELTKAQKDFILFTDRWVRPHHVKAVVTDMEDLLWLEENFMPLLTNANHPILLTPAAGPKYTLEKINNVVNMVLGWNKGYNIRCVAQQHVMLKFR